MRVDEQEQAEWQEALSQPIVPEELQPLVSLPKNPATEELERALREFAKRLAGADKLRRSVVIAGAVDHLKSIGVRSPASQVEASTSSLRGEEKCDGQGTRLSFADLEPWPAPVDCGQLLAEIADAYRRHVVLPEGCAQALALWTVFTYCHDRFDIAPRLCLTSAVMRCGKTTCLSVLQSLVYYPIPASNLTASVLYRFVDRYRGTLLIDEADCFLKENAELRSVVNAGHSRRFGYVSRCEGENNEPRLFRCFGPAAIAMIGKPNQTILDRSINVELKRRTRDEQVERLRGDTLAAECEPLRRQCARWVEDHGEELAAADPALPEELHDRAADNWRPLLAIADAAGGNWPERARWAALMLSGDRHGDEESWRVLALEDLKAVFAARQTDRLSTKDVLAEFHNLEERPWPTFSRSGKPMSARHLADLLKDFGVRSKSIKLPDGTTAKGFLLDECADAFTRYLQGDLSVTGGTSLNDKDLGDFAKVTEDGQVTDGKSHKPLSTKESYGVTDRLPPEGVDGGAGGTFVPMSPAAADSLRQSAEHRKRQETWRRQIRARAEEQRGGRAS